MDGAPHSYKEVLIAIHLLKEFIQKQVPKNSKKKRER
jgi:hypothetical protein